MSFSPELYELIVKIVEDKIKDIKVTREEFEDVKNVLRELISIQRNSIDMLKNVAKVVVEIAKLQKETMETISKLAEAQRRTEEAIEKLSRRVDELAEAQRRTEEAVERLSKRVDELAEAQKRTEESLAKLSNEVRGLARQVGRLSDTIGFGLEDIARVMLPGWLERNLGIYVDELTSVFITVDGEEIQLNLFGYGKKNGREIVIVGECRSRIYGRDVESFSKILEKARKYFAGKEVLGVLFGYLIHPSAQKEAEKYGIKVVATYMR